MMMAPCLEFLLFGVRILEICQKYWTISQIMKCFQPHVCTEGQPRSRFSSWVSSFCFIRLCCLAFVRATAKKEMAFLQSPPLKHGIGRGVSWNSMYASISLFGEDCIYIYIYRYGIGDPPPLPVVVGGIFLPRGFSGQGTGSTGCPAGTQELLRSDSAPALPENWAREMPEQNARRGGPLVLKKALAFAEMFLCLFLFNPPVGFKGIYHY